MTKLIRNVVEVDLRSLNQDARSVSAVLSTEAPVARFDGSEVLDHGPDAINLERARNGLPLLWAHDTADLIGIVEDVKIVERKLRGTLRFGNSSRAAEMWKDVAAGIIRSLSIGYSIDESERTGDGIRAKRWTLYEASLVAVPADIQAGIGRQMETTAMTTQSTDLKVWQARETERRQAIRAASDMFNFAHDSLRQAELEALRDSALDDANTTVETFSTRLLELVGRAVSPAGNGARMQSEFSGLPRVSAGSTSAEKTASAIKNALAVRSGVERDPNVIAEVNASGMRGQSLLTHGREHLRSMGVDTSRLSDKQIADYMLGRAAPFVRSGLTPSHGVSDFSALMLDVANKNLAMGFQEAPETWRPWVKSMSASDFKLHYVLGMSGYGDLDVVPEHAEYKYGTFSDVRESSSLRTYGKLFSITRQAIINDDTAAFTQVPALMGRAASRMIGDECYSVLTSNPTLSQDSLALFHATHGNYVSTGGSAPSVTSLDAGSAAMGTRTDPAGNTLNIAPRYLIVPRALEATARTLAAATYDPAGTAGTLKPNPFNGRFDVVADARLDAFNAAGWFLAADANIFPGVVLLLLDGVETPYVEAEPLFIVDGVSYKVRIDCRAFAVDYRPLYYNDGA